MSEEKKILLIDMDQVMVNFYEHPAKHLNIRGKARLADYPWTERNPPEMYEKGFWENLLPLEGAKEAIKELSKYYDVWICSQPVATHPASYSGKVKWIDAHYPDLVKKVIFTQDKALIYGDYLIDDNDDWLKTFTVGKPIKFNDREPANSWRVITKMLIKEAKNETQTESMEQGRETTEGTGGSGN